MKNIVFALLVAGVAGIAGSRPASAQSNPVLVKIPFEFIVGQTVLPAGSYRIAAAGEDPAVLLVENTQTAVRAGFVATESSPVADAGEPAAQFKNVDGHMFLWRVAVPGDGAREVLLTKANAERVLARLNLAPAEPVTDAVK